MSTLGVWLRFETFPTHVEAPLASFAIFSIGATILIIRIANRVAIWHILLTALGKLKRLILYLTLVEHTMREATSLRFTVSPASISRWLFGGLVLVEFVFLCFCCFVCLVRCCCFAFHVFEIFLVVLRSRTTVGAKNFSIRPEEFEA